MLYLCRVNNELCAILLLTQPTKPIINKKSIYGIY